MNENETGWLNIADVMSALMMIFMFIAVTFLFQLENEKEVFKVNEKTWIEKKRRIGKNEKEVFKVNLNEVLHQEFGNDLYRWKATITPDNIVRFDSPFGTGESEVPDAFKLILDEFFPRYIALLTQPLFKNEILEVRVEGHTSRDWGTIEDPKKVYLYNMDLSQKRASNVLAYCYNLYEDSIIRNRQWLEEKLRANGMAFAKLLYSDDGVTQDQNRSKRVEFMVITKEHATKIEVGK